ncbi:hypothetical protein JMUB4039_0358 [Leptotrichia trevisanii]|uniref:hypothetical protein n=1 Tax=Leptotrichia trevisanii TaxID=109328 RepID=UPI00118CE725|nr:hypothetical protein [Leptotrichia trevisanii]BBM56391.1 hypothetical protein JMUB4039_0358 [Leptotrichia trevisanii]
MKKILLVIMMLTMSVIGFSKSKITDKTYKGDYTRATNTFTYIKDNLVFPNKTLTFIVKDNSGLMDRIYDFMKQKYGVEDSDIVTFDVKGTVSKNGVLTIKKILNYQIPEYKLHASDFGTTPSSTSTIQENSETTTTNDSSNLNNPASFFNQETGN